MPDKDTKLLAEAYTQVNESMFTSLASEFKKWLGEVGVEEITKQHLNEFKKIKGLKWNDPTARKLFVFVGKTPDAISINPMSKSGGFSPRRRPQYNDYDYKEMVGDYDDVQPDESYEEYEQRMRRYGRGPR